MDYLTLNLAFAGIFVRGIFFIFTEFSFNMFLEEFVLDIYFEWIYSMEIVFKDI